VIGYGLYLRVRFPTGQYIPFRHSCVQFGSGEPQLLILRTLRFNGEDNTPLPIYAARAGCRDAGSTNLSSFFFRFVIMVFRPQSNVYKIYHYYLLFVKARVNTKLGFIVFLLEFCLEVLSTSVYVKLSCRLRHRVSNLFNFYLI
jgi:hypothetical protein